MWLYIPNVGKPIRITSLQSVVGGVFNNADILNLDYTEEYHGGKSRGDRRGTTSSTSRPKKIVAYDRLKMWVDKGNKLPTRIECLTEAAMLIKTIYFKEIKGLRRRDRPPCGYRNGQSPLQGFQIHHGVGQA